jgi:pSer/pThr/pTyr-binding forkhead associated (FHA) protein
VLTVHVPLKPPHRMEVQAGTLRIGRSADNEVVVDDDRVSRRHGRLAVRQGMLVYTDLGSTNGSYLNGTAVTEIALGPGDVLQLGSSTITIEPTH